MPKVMIDGLTVEVPAGTTILQAAKLVNIKIPTLCHHPDQAVKANCRICVVEVNGARVLQPACSYPVSDGMVVTTNTPGVRRARRNILELILAHHPQDCLKCYRNGNCELQTVAAEMNFTDDLRFPLAVRNELQKGHLLAVSGPRHLQMHRLSALRICVLRGADCPRPRQEQPQF